MDLPHSLDPLGASDAGRRWLRSLPELVQDCERNWSLVLGTPYSDSHFSLVVPARTHDGNDAVLKLQFPDRESEREAAALATWNGGGAIRLLRNDAARRALLVERCRPGTPLSELPSDEALDVIITLLPRLWVAGTVPVRSLRDEAAHWTRQLPPRFELAGRPFETELLDAALEALDTLPRSQGEPVLLHQDLHADNVLRAEREPWLVIDPKPLVGEREFGLAPVIRSAELGHGREHVERRLDRLTTQLHLDRERTRQWALAQTIAWAFDDGDVLPRHVETARWLHDMR
jgi:streptomycin 6-kinase